jgi:hypothetical protein
MYFYLPCVTHHCTKYVEEKNQRRERRERRWYGMPFTLHHCWAQLEHDENWMNNDVLEVPKRRTKSFMGDATVVDENEASSEDGKKIPTPNLVGKMNISNKIKYPLEGGN